MMSCDNNYLRKALFDFQTANELSDFKTSIQVLNILFRAYNLMMNKIIRSLIDIVNKVKKCKISLKF